jgi:hypothetical protein
MMLTLTLGLLLLAGGAAGRFPLVGTRANGSVAFVGAVLSLVGLGRLVRKRRVEHDEAATDGHSNKPARAA